MKAIDYNGHSGSYNRGNIGLSDQMMKLMD